MIDERRERMKNYYGVDLQLLIKSSVIDLKKIIGPESGRLGNSVLAKRVGNQLFTGHGAYVKLLYTSENDFSTPSIYEEISLSKKELELSQKFNDQISPKELHREDVEGRYGNLTLLCQEYYAGSVEEFDFTSRKLKKLVRDLASKLHVVHEEEIMHRDVKPANILFRKKRRKMWHPFKSYEFTLTDFGVSQNYNRVLLDASRDLFAGTLLYISPEYFCCEVSDHSDLERAEIFSYGMTLAHYATIGDPFNDNNTIFPDTQKEISAFYRKDKHRAFFQISMRKIPKGSKELIMACLDPNPHNRPQSFGKIVTSLS